MPPSLLPEEGRKEGRQAGPPLHGRGGSALLLTVEQAGAVAVPGYLQPRVLLHSPGTRPRGWGGGERQAERIDCRGDPLLGGGFRSGKAGQEGAAALPGAGRAPPSLIGSAAAALGGDLC